MAIPDEYRKKVKFRLLNCKMSVEQAERFLDNAYKTYAECPGCEEDKYVYATSQKSVNVSGGSRLFMGLLSYGATELMGPSGKYYYCLDCGSFWF